MGLKALRYQAESHLFKVYNGFNAPPRLDDISARTKRESATNYYVLIFIGTPTIRKGRTFYTKEIDSKYLKRLLEGGHLFSLHDLEIEAVDPQSFFSPYNFSRIVKYAWWTFGVDFQKELEVAAQNISAHLLPSFFDTLSKNTSPYQMEDSVVKVALEPDAVKFARVKKLHCFKNHDEYLGAALKDEENRKMILKLLKKRRQIFNCIENKSDQKRKRSVQYREFSDLFVNDEWREKFDFVLSLLKPNYDSIKESPRLIDVMQDKGREGKVPSNSHFQLFFITYMFMSYGAFKASEQDLSIICRKLYKYLRIGLDTTKFSYHSTVVLNKNRHVGGKATIKEELTVILARCNYV